MTVALARWTHINARQRTLADLRNIVLASTVLTETLKDTGHTLNYAYDKTPKGFSKSTHHRYGNNGTTGLKKYTIVPDVQVHSCATFGLQNESPIMLAPMLC